MVERTQLAARTEPSRLKPSWRAVAAITGDPAYTGVLQRDEQAAEEARKIVEMVLAVWKLEQLAEDANLLVTELMSNAARHARGPFVRITVTRTARYRVRVAVTDKSRNLPKLVVGDPMDETGRGLRLVDAMSKTWGVIPYNWGKSVWAEVAAS